MARSRRTLPTQHQGHKRSLRILTEIFFFFAFIDVIVVAVASGLSWPLVVAIVVATSFVNAVSAVSFLVVTQEIPRGKGQNSRNSEFYKWLELNI